VKLIRKRLVNAPGAEPAVHDATLSHTRRQRRARLRDAGPATGPRLTDQAGFTSAGRVLNVVPSSAFTSTQSPLTVLLTPTTLPDLYSLPRTVRALTCWPFLNVLMKLLVDEKKLRLLFPAGHLPYVSMVCYLGSFPRMSMRPQGEFGRRSLMFMPLLSRLVIMPTKRRAG